MDTNTKWWTDQELNNYLDSWQDDVQNNLELIWGTASVVTASATLTLSSIMTDMLRLDAVYWNDVRLSYLTKEELDNLKREWRTQTSATPKVTYQDSFETISFWPSGISGTAKFEYPQTGSFATDTSTMFLPAWVKYSAMPYCSWRAFMRAGPNQSRDKALAKRSEFAQALRRGKTIFTNFLPDKYLSIRPGDIYEFDLLNPDTTGGSTVPSVTTRATEIDEIPAGAVNGSNPTFTLTYSPNPTNSLHLYVSGIRQTVTTHYTLSGSTITFVSPFIPQTGEPIFANYKALV